MIIELLRFDEHDFPTPVSAKKQQVENTPHSPQPARGGQSDGQSDEMDTPKTKKEIRICIGGRACLHVFFLFINDDTT